MNGKPISGSKVIGMGRALLVASLLILLGVAETVTGGALPDQPDKNARLKQCADILRTAINTNQIEMDCRKLTNQPEVVLAIRNYSLRTLSNLDEAAILLTNAHLKTFTADYGEGAEIVNPKNKNERFDFVFYHNGPVLQFRKATVDGNHTGMQMGFHANGNLRGELGGHLEFRSNGQLDHCFIDGKYILIPITPGRYVAGDAEGQLKIYNEFYQARDAAMKGRDAGLLSNLWRDGRLDDAIKDQLAQEHYHLVLRQILSSGGVPCWEVRCSQTFPFPDVFTDFTATQYVNDQIQGTPGESCKSCSMTSTNDAIAGQSGGILKNGDVVRYKIDLTQTDRERGRQWQISLWSNKITLQTLKN